MQAGLWTCQKLYSLYSSFAAEGKGQRLADVKQQRRTAKGPHHLEDRQAVCPNRQLKKNITTHTFRHTCASHMLKNGAPIRHLQEMLGHASLESTQIYTHVTINDLKEIHARYHPSETM